MENDIGGIGVKRFRTGRSNLHREPFHESTDVVRPSLIFYNSDSGVAHQREKTGAQSSLDFARQTSDKSDVCHWL